jgi:outer membrane protein insertion porin family
MHRPSLLLIAIAVFLACFSFSVRAQETGAPVIHKITLTGNQRVEPSTIYSYLGLKEGGHYNPYDADTALKNLYATGFFADVTITPSELPDNRVDLDVHVVENPIINRVAFEGNSHVEEKDLLNEIELKPRTIYTRTKIQNDVKRILDIYRRSGRYSAKVDPKIITLDQNRVDLVFEINEGTVTKVQSITFIGNEHFTGKTLRNAIRTEETRWYRFFSDNDKYDPDRLQYDQELLRRFYNSEGYADFQVKSAIVELTPSRDAFYVTFTIDEGPKYKFGDVSIDANLKGVNNDKLKEYLTTRSGKTYNGTAIEDSIDALTKALGDMGYAFIDIDPQLKRDPEKRTIDLVYEVKEGPRVYVERINIFGNVRTLDEVIRREFRLTEGDAYSASKLARTEQRLNNLGFFEKVDIKTEPGSRPDRMVINVSVQEKSTGEISIGAGFSTQDGPLADFGIREKNFLGKGQDLRFKGTIAARRQQYDIGFTEPYFLNRELAAGFDIFRIQQDLLDESSFQRDSNGASVHMGYALTEKWTHNLNYTFRFNNIYDIQPGASIYVLQQEGKTTNSSVGHNFTYEGRDNKNDPTSGVYFQVAQEFAGLGGDTHYIKHEVKAGYYYPVYKKWVASVSGLGGDIIGLGEHVRIQDRFFLGGREMRGFEDSGIGPRDTTTRDALGGNIYYIGSAELSFPLSSSDDLGLRGAFFTDIGSLWRADDNGPNVSDSRAPRVAAGFGVLWASPFGPIRIDIAKALVKQDVDRTQIFQFSFGTRF